MRFIKKVLLFTLLITIASLSAMAQQRDKKYDSLWKKVDDLTNKQGLTKSALTEVGKILQMSKKEKNDAQMIKALLYQASLNETFDDGVEATSGIARLEKESASFNEPALSIYNSILATNYLNYFQRQRYKFYGRTETGNFKKDDPATWSLNNFHSRISSLFLSSISNKKLLQQTKLEPYDAIIVKGNARYLRPTLYDLLAHRALEYFRSDERDINRPSYAFEVKDSNLFQPAESFAKLPITTNDSLSLHHKALLICQDLVDFHLHDLKPDALIDADIMRIEIVNQFGIMENKDSLYTSALDHLFTKYPLEPAAAKAGYLLAQWQINKAVSYDPLKDSTNRYAYLKALAICETIAAQPKESEGKSNCLGLINQIKQREINLQTEKVNIPDLPFRTLVSFRNFTRLNFRIIPVTEQQQRQFANRYDDNYWKQIIALPSSHSWSQAFPSTGDYQKHHAEVMIDGLPVGTYALLASVDDNYSLNNNPLALEFFHVSNISYINNGSDYFVLNRENGKPLEKASVQVWNTGYDPDQRKTTFVKGAQQLTDKNGYFNMVGKTGPTSNQRLQIQYKKDQLFLNDFEYQRYRSETGAELTAAAFERQQANVFFFTDRSIYRPGQTVYFKGIAITRDYSTRRSKTYLNQKSTVTLYDANGEPVDSLQLVTNEFGSYSGSFKLPLNLLNGAFQIRQSNIPGEASFSVEEYKRPKFYTEFENIKTTYRVNDSIRVTGMAKAYAGNSIGGATVKFRVVRTPRFVYPWLSSKIGSPRSGSMEIANGTATTSAEGRFAVTFKAIPDATIDKMLDPIFDYRLTADVVDINGETRTAETTIHVSYKALQLQITGLIPRAVIPVDSLRNLGVRTQNLDGEFVSTRVTVSIYRLKAPDRLIRARYWRQPDMHLMSKEVYSSLFPYDEYADELNTDKWERAEKVYSRSDSTNVRNTFEVSGKEFTTGWYAVEVLAKDAFGAEVKDVRNIQLLDGRNMIPAVFLWSMQQGKTVEPGNKSIITIGTSAKDLYVIQQVSRTTAIKNNKLTEGLEQYKFLNLTNEQKSFDFAVSEEDRGGFAVTNFFVKNNRFFVGSEEVDVPWTNKELAITYESFRDKTLPGSDEKWRVKINGNKNEKVAVEMLASMYDASLDQFRAHGWTVPAVWPEYSNNESWDGFKNFTSVQSDERNVVTNQPTYVETRYDALIQPSGSVPMQLRGKISGISIGGAPSPRNASALERVNENSKIAFDAEMSDIVVVGYGTKKQVAFESQATPPVSVQPRKNFNETAFFLPDLKTDSSGSISFGFTIPEALTQWKFQALAHTRDAAFGYATRDVITQKQLMVQPNAPRFFREGDHVSLSTKIVNTSAKDVTGTVHLELLNAADMQPIDGWFQNMTANQYFTAEAGKAVVASFTIQVPYQFNSAVVYRFTAKSDSAGFSDGEEASLPVLSNSMLVTESLPLNIHGSGNKKFNFTKLLQSGSSETLQQHSLTVEYTSNPAWYAVQALPYLVDYPYECSEQTFNRFYANALATKIANASPRLQAIFSKWQLSATDKAKTGSLLSNLEKNPELKSALLEETPWVLEARSEAEQKKNIALLFDMVKMKDALQTMILKLKQAQLTNGGFPWFTGGPDDRFITQYILTGIGHLKKLGALPASETLDNVTRQGISYLDKRLKEDYDNLIRSKSDLAKNNTGYTQLQYLYMRSFFNQTGIPGETFPAANYYRKQSQQFWLQTNRYMQGMTALALNRSGDRKTATDILRSLKQNAIVSPETGMYWKENHGGYFWYQAPVETQSLLVEAFSEIGKDTKTVDELKTWLLRQKQTQHWSSTKATADACYALLLQGTDWLSSEPNVEIKLGTRMVSSTTQTPEAGTGYFKTVIDRPFVNPAMGDISVSISKPGETAATGSSWGAVYWQYFEKLDKITPSATPLQLTKKLFVEKNSDRGPVLEPISDGAAIKVGDKVKVRIELRVDRDMEYVQLKDMRAACMEPVNVLSSYKYQDGLGYYESTRDASTNFFFNWLPKGVYVFEYGLFATQAGNFSNGVSSIQCMYAPEFASHSEGIRVNVE